LLPTDTLYVDWAAINNGSASVPASPSYYFDLYLDGSFWGRWQAAFQLDPTYYLSVSDVSLGSLSAGVHTLRLVCDSTGVVGESNESDNEYTKEFVVGTQAYLENFESGAPGWHVYGNLWHLSAACSAAVAGHSTPTDYYFGQDGTCNYNTGSAVSGTLESPEIDFTGASGSLQLVFSSFLATESLVGFDKATVFYSFDRTTWTVLDRDQANGGGLTNTGGWTTPTYSVNTWAGHHVWLRFSFDSVDQYANTAEGWHIDDVKVVGNCPTCTFTGSDYYALAPCRLLDTRNANGPLGGPILSNGVVRSFTVAGVCGIPSDARAISVNVTVTLGTAAGQLVAYPGHGPTPVASTISFPATRAMAGMCQIRLAPDGSFDVVSTGADVNFILDVNGYYK